jgi:hypothetical protein
MSYLVNPYMVSPSVVEDCQSEGTAESYMQEPPSGGGSGNAQMYGCKMESGSVFVGETYSSAKVFLKKEAGTPSHSVPVGIWRIYNEGWTQTGSYVTLGNQTGIDIDTVGRSGTQKQRRLIGTTLSDTAWVLRFKLLHTDSGGAESPILALCASNTTGNDFWSDAIMVYANSSGSDPAQLAATYYTSGGTNAQSGSITLVDATTYYVELIRTASDNVTISVFTGSDYSTGQVGSTQALNSSNITGIDDLISIQSALGTTNGARDIDVTIQEIRIYDGITSVGSESPTFIDTFGKDPVHTFETKNTSGISTSITEYTFSGGGDYTIQANDIIAINWTNEDYKLYTYTYDSAVTDLPQMRFNQWDDPDRITWSIFTSASLRFCLGA